MDKILEKLLKLNLEKFNKVYINNNKLVIKFNSDKILDEDKIDNIILYFQSKLDYKTLLEFNSVLYTIKLNNKYTVLLKLYAKNYKTGVRI